MGGGGGGIPPLPSHTQSSCYARSSVESLCSIISVECVFSLQSLIIFFFYYRERRLKTDSTE